MNSSVLYRFSPKDAHHIKKLRRCNRRELSQLHEKNSQLLNNHAFVQKLSDNGAKLRETNQLIEALLIDERTITAHDMITADNTNLGHCPLTRKLEAMSLMTPRQESRKSQLSRRLLKIKRAHLLGSEQVKARMLTLDESLRLQTMQLSKPDIHNKADSLNPPLLEIPLSVGQDYEFPFDEDSCNEDNNNNNSDDMILL
ncbi:uncharacterized protein RHIMIDRAFT_243018 [Rhizopus microsporus ATCC 52813]|uniref:Uncharacterized protein n=1 Tax=Rhizopus microsporus ATCC 52813 TaxID=1340429 RepID=A0A2G4T780_RHIZD|nr:uncharacterized protein RHIMIDRAFT_243018 [Rhizopus microsporus ATCC 52813]PHZ16858.1 hypothetical protein RHIMIDRAFT_243018 [Rhizopus microsporus ATCC 52813]